MSSKIKVDTIENVAGSGNVSLGSGHNLVVPGNITGSGTATITGDLAVDTNVLKVDTSNNRVGINTTSPSNDLHISSTNPVIRLQDTSTDAYAQIFTNDAGSIRLRADAGNSQASSDFILEIDGTTRLSVDSSGHVLKPNTPAFNIRHYGASASTSNRTIGNTNSGGTVVEITDVGSHFDTSNGRFTAPVGGTYAFFASTTNGAASNSAVYIYKNSSSQLSQTGYHYGVAYNGTGVSAIAVLSANDFVTALFAPLNSQSDTMYDSGFTGFLIG